MTLQPWTIQISIAILLAYIILRELNSWKLQQQLIQFKSQDRKDLHLF